MSDDFPEYFSSRCLFNKADCVLLPHLSTPSKRMNAPLSGEDDAVISDAIGNFITGLSADMTYFQIKTETAHRQFRIFLREGENLNL